MSDSRRHSNALPEAEYANYPLSPCRLIKLQQYYYAIGNSPARNIFYRNISHNFENVELMKPNSWIYHNFDPNFEKALERSSEQVQDLRVLCLACGDLRNVLFSLGSTKGIGSVELVINDYDIYVLARNILILDMLFDSPASTEADETIFAIWFSTALLDHQLSALRLSLRKLIDQSTENGSTWKWRCAEPGLLGKLRKTWEKWLVFFPLSSETHLTHWEHTQEMRHVTFLEKGIQLLTAAGDADVDGETAKSRLRSFIKKHRALTLSTHLSINIDERRVEPEIRSVWETEVEEHLLTGIFLPSSSGTVLNEKYYHVNPTLFQSQEKYDLHYGTDSFSAFPIFLPTAGSTAVDSCYKVFKTCLAKARENRQKVSWTFSSLDCQTFCLTFNATRFGWDDEAATAIRPKKGFHASQLSRGALVVTGGLQKSPGLNGIIGVVTRKAPEAGRWGVQLIKPMSLSSTLAVDMPKKPVSLSERNLSIVKPGCGLSDKSDSSACFDVITTSNVADHIGLSTLLLVTRPLLVAGGTLFTTSFLHGRRYGGSRNYLKASLLESNPSWWTTLFRFRAMGYEGNACTSSACKIAHSEYEPPVPLNRKDSTIVWLATNSDSNLNLAEDGPIARHLTGLSRNTSDQLSGHNLCGKAVALLCRHGCSSVLDTTSKQHAEEGVLRDLLTPPYSTDVSLMSFQVDDGVLRKILCSATSSPTPTVYVELKSITTFGVWLEQPASDEENQATRFFFWCRRRFVEESCWTASLCCKDPIAPKKIHNIKVEEFIASNEKMGRLVSLLSGCQGCATQTTSAPMSKERDSTMELICFSIFDESDDCIMIQVQPKTEFFGTNPIPPDAFRVEPSNSFAITVKVSLPGVRYARDIIAKDLIFSVPVKACDWRLEPSKGLLFIRKGAYGFFSAVRTSAILGCTYCDLTGSEEVGWTESALQTFSGLQLTSQERAHLRRKDSSTDGCKMPMLAEVKHTIMSLIQLQTQLVLLQIKEADIGYVAIIVRHGILMDSLKAHPVLDLSVCFLSSETCLEMADLVYRLDESGRGMSQIEMWIEEYRLFQNLCNFIRATMAPELRVEHPSLRVLFEAKSARANFRRVLLKPLFPSAGESEDVFREATGGFFLREMMNLLSGN